MNARQKGTNGVAMHGNESPEENGICLFFVFIIFKCFFA